MLHVLSCQLKACTGQHLMLGSCAAKVPFATYATTGAPHWLSPHSLTATQEDIRDMKSIFWRQLEECVQQLNSAQKEAARLRGTAGGSGAGAGLDAGSDGQHKVG